MQGDDLEAQVYRPDSTAPVTHNCPEPVKLIVNATVRGAVAAEAPAAPTSRTRPAANPTESLELLATAPSERKALTAKCVLQRWIGVRGEKSACGGHGAASSLRIGSVSAIWSDA